ncbi:MAG: serine/threonine protein kinase, partial [Myxococcota bacterium]|nr:serine/threonine protein kinase [Myxococcota bacterium]
MSQRTSYPQWEVPRPGETIAGDYVLGATCGRGPLAVVFSATHARSGEAVAVKVMLPHCAGDAEAIGRFLREASAARLLESEHFARVLDVGTLESGAPYAVIEPVAGESLQEVLARWQPLPMSTAVDWIMEASEAIGEAHLHGIVHGALSPSSLVLARRPNANDEGPCLKVIDFVLSRARQPPEARDSSRDAGATPLGDAPYCLAPEQLRASNETDARTDVWALGAVLYELLSGEPPFSGSTLPQVCAAVLKDAPRSLRSVRPEIPLDLERVVARCLKKEREERFEGIPEMARALARFGTSAAGVSLANLERLVAVPRRNGAQSAVASLSQPSNPLSSRDFLPASSTSRPSLASRPSRESLLAEAYFPRRRGPFSARVVLVSLLMMTAIGALAFLGLYGSVHGSPVHLGRATGVTAVQPTTDPSVVPLAAIPPPQPAASISALVVAPPPAPATPIETARASSTASNAGAGGSLPVAVPAAAAQNLGRSGAPHAVAVPRP